MGDFLGVKEMIIVGKRCIWEHWIDVSLYIMFVKSLHSSKMLEYFLILCFTFVCM